jgi:adenylate cyclase
MELSKPTPKRKTTIAISASSIVLALALNFTTIFQNIELKIIDWQFWLRGSIPAKESPIVIIAIDDQSDESTPHRWPWPRSYYARVIENLNEAGAAVIGLDVILEQADSFNPQSDDSLSRVLKKYDNVVLTGKVFELEYQGNVGLVEPHEKFIDGKAVWGVAAIEADLDGFYRTYHMAQEYGEILLPSFGAQILKKYYGMADSTEVTADNHFFYLEDLNIPKFDIYNILINFMGPAYSFQYYSFDNVLDDAEFDLLEDYDMDAFDDPGDPKIGIPPGLKYSGELKDKIVLIGSTMIELHDNFPTPFLEYVTPDGSQKRAETPGVEIHANAIQTILSEKYYTKVSPLYILLLLIFLTVAMHFISKKLTTLWAGIVTVSILITYFGTTIFLFSQARIIIELVAPVLLIFFNYTGHTVYQYILTQREKKVIRGAFSHYVPEKFVEQILSDPQKLSLGGEEKIISVLFSDVAGFTSISEKLTPRQLVALLNEYLTEMTDIILNNNGIIDKYEGDAIMAEFGMPVYYPNHAYVACKTALEMQAKLRELRKEWAKRGQPQLTARIGINTGEVIVGNMGSRDVFDYTVIGDHVNLGSRLEGANKAYSTQIMISEFTNGMIEDDFYTRSLDFIRVKGKTKPIEVYELIAEKTTILAPKFIEFLKVYNQGIYTYRDRDWQTALEYFERCLTLYPKDAPSVLYKGRCEQYNASPPPESWDGVTILTEK